MLGARIPTYPLQKKGHSFEFLREKAHLRPRTNTFGAIARVRNALCAAIHNFFQARGFLYVQTPIITTSDCEGAGQVFQVTTLDLARLQQSKGPLDYAQDFFGKKAGLTVSGQLEGEIFATAVGDVYTFGPTFRAENSNTTRHLAEFWMVEPEMPFYALEDNMDLAESFVRTIVKDLLERCEEDLAFFNERIEPKLFDSLHNIVDHEFIRLTYTEAVSQEKSDPQPSLRSLGKDMQSSTTVSDRHFKQPEIMTDYRVRSNRFICSRNDGKTVGHGLSFPIG